MLVALAAACGRDGEGAGKIDTAVLPPRATITAERTAAPAAADTLAGTGDERPPKRPTRAAPPAASASELDELAGELVVPVSGVERATLPDNFNEARGSRRHNAMDILAPRGTPVIAAAAGRIEALHTSKAGGLMVYQSDRSGRFILMYAHLDRYAAGIREEMAVRRGQVIGYVGTTGNAPPNTPHLHFAISRVGDPDDWWRGTPVDPRPMLVRSR